MDYLKLVLLAVILFLLILNYFQQCEVTENSDEAKKIITDLIISEDSNLDVQIKEWHTFISALIEVESMGKDSAIGKSNDVGVLQITPIYVEETNRILGENKYNLDDRFDRYKSIEMFTVINEKHNPEKSFNKALRLHNPNAGNAYKIKVFEKYYELLNN